VVNARSFALAALVVALAYAAGPRPVFLYSEFHCPTGHTQRAVGVQAGMHVCDPPGGLASNPYVSRITERKVGLYLANLHVRVFDFDLQQDSYLGFAVGVP
jgi:hypothetical protein